ncbi:IS607 family element RNA-guided endonuclease TnpB [Glycomyces xiaoerkulensis]|uniref:IS607 family element RNA-guided endonuclease TnpB n=1 Tax=Glycomyces xiaoerkulensis TaxID=2038139 RepID=UPI000C269CFE|nr:IS607 family element RNA-guided endonuclease TnpB [Glycomyces xiaoerkulensis]
MSKPFEPREGCVVQAYRFTLDPNAGQIESLASHCGAAREAYNWAVGYVLAAWDQRAAEESYGIPGTERTPWRSWSLASLRREWNRVKKTDPRYAWWAENSKEAYNTGLAAAQAAFDNYTKSKHGKRAGKPMGVPRFKSKRRARRSCRFTTGTIRIEPDRRHVTLPRLGAIRTHEKTAKLQRRLAKGTARILSATVSLHRGRWQVAFQIEVERAQTRPARPEATIGIDLGVKHLAVTADTDGAVDYVDNPSHIDQALKQLRRASRKVSRRRGPDRRTRQQASRRWMRANAERDRIHHRVANLRENALHQLTTRIAAEYGTVVVEDLNVAGMLRNRRLARRIADAGFGTIRRHLAYKTGWNAGNLVVADRWFPSSKTCSGCGAVKAKLPLHVRVFECDTCGLLTDRDANAALNLAALAAACSTGTGVAGDQAAQAAKPRGADVRPAQRATGVEAGDRRQDTGQQLGEPVTDLPSGNARNADIRLRN